jgi:probable FeS assembly SUF system protein SufT
MAQKQTQLTRDVDATLIPQGETCTLPQGTEVTITHTLGGNYTVMTPNGMFRISRENADALGEKQEDEENPVQAAKEHPGPPDPDALWEQLRQVYDPEIPVNIVDLGLVYKLDVEKKEDESYFVHVDMTLTAPGCGMGPTIAADAHSRLMQVPGTHDAAVDIVWDPPWTQDLISEEGKMQLGLI